MGKERNHDAESAFRLVGLGGEIDGGIVERRGDFHFHDGIPVAVPPFRESIRIGKLRPGAEGREDDAQCDAHDQPTPVGTSK